MWSPKRAWPTSTRPPAWPIGARRWPRSPGVTPIGRRIGRHGSVERLRRDGLVALPEDLGVDVRPAEPLAARRAQHRDLVAWSGGLYDPPAQFRDLVTAMLLAEAAVDLGLRDNPPLTSRAIADLAVAALRAEAELTPKPGLVDRRGSGAHTDMDLGMLLASAEALHEGFAECARAAQEMPLGVELRARLGVIGRMAERQMLAATGGVNTHRGALWALGLLAAGVARHREVHCAIRVRRCAGTSYRTGAPRPHRLTWRAGPAKGTARQVRRARRAPASPMSSAMPYLPFGAAGPAAQTRRPPVWTRCWL